MGEAGVAVPDRRSGRIAERQHGDSDHHEDSSVVSLPDA